MSISRRVLTIAAAAVVVIVPAACGSAAATTPSGHSDHGGSTDPDVRSVAEGAVDEPETEGEAAHEEPVPHKHAHDESADESAGEDAVQDEPVQEGPTDDGPAEDGATAPDGDAPDGDAGEGPRPVAEEEREPENAPAAPPVASGPEILGDDCSTSRLEPHDGFQNAPRCVGIAFGEVAAADRSPSLLITDAPDTVASGEAFTLQVSTRNLVRDRFLGAAAGGYYRESSFLDADGIQRGHFHTACRLLPSVDEAPDAEPAPEFFVATQDNGGGAEPDLVDVPILGIEGSGELQCTVWAGDGSHRVPMMQRANQTPAFDAVRITVE